MYQDRFAVAIKHNGKILRENKDLVHLPYGSEFSVLVKNLNSRRAKFILHIDGTDVLDGEEIIVRGNSEVEVKRFIRNGNMNEGNAFKFIERTKSVEDGPRGINVDDGVVRVEFWFEQEQAEIKINDIYWDKHHYRDYYHQPYTWPPIIGRYGCVSTGISGASGSLGDSQFMNASCASSLRGVVNQVSETYDSATVDPHMGSVCADNRAIPVSDIGITVPGSKVDQKFTPVFGFKSELNSHVIILRMVGMIGTVEVAAPILVKNKQRCGTCGKVNKANAKFCSECGTGLEIL
jgi:hypothetical protein